MSDAPLSWSALEAVHEHFRRKAFALVEDGQELAPQLFAVRANPRGEILQMKPFPADIMRRAFADDLGKRAFALMLRDLTNDTTFRAANLRLLGFTPNVYVQIAEAWFVMRDAEDGKLIEASLPVSAQADRRECVFIALHLTGRSVVVRHEIVDKPRRHALRGAFPADNADLAASRGLFAMQDPTRGKREKRDG
jgi:hypothetical protein